MLEDSHKQADDQATGSRPRRSPQTQTSVRENTQKAAWWAWFKEGFTYRLGDVAIALIVSFGWALFLTHDLDLSSEFGSGAAIIENLLNTAWYITNKYIWFRRQHG